MVRPYNSRCCNLHYIQRAPVTLYCLISPSYHIGSKNSFQVTNTPKNLKTAKSKSHINLKKKIIILCSLVIATGSWKWLSLWDFKKELPWGASEIYEWYQQETLLPDYVYFLRAKISQEEFFKYIKKLDLEKHTDSSSYPDEKAGLSWAASYGVDTKVWNPSESLKETYVWQKGHEWVLAKYENGFVYLKALNH